MRSEWEMKAEHILRQALSGDGAPYTLEIHPTFKCNLHCVFCLQEATRARGLVGYEHELTTEQWLAVIRDAASQGVREVRICGGGEPMYEPASLLRMMKEIKAHGLRGYLTTNGTMFSEKMCRFVVGRGWERIEFSIDTPRRELHDRMRGMAGTFDRALHAIKRICRLRKKAGAKKPFIVINMVVMNCNYQEIPEMVKLFGPIGADQLLLLQLHHREGIGDDLVLSPGEIGEMCKAVVRAKRAAASHGMEVCSHNIDAELATREKEKGVLPASSHRDNPPEGKDEEGALEGDPRLIELLASSCYEPWYYLQICHDGIYSPCCNSYRNEDGETFHTHSFEHVWQRGKHVNAVRRNLRKNVFTGVCRQCDMVRLVRTSQIRDFLFAACERHGLLPQQTIDALRERSQHLRMPLGGV